MPFEKLIVGLGNPGEEYEHTAHNLGFLVVERLAERNGIRIGRKDSMALVGQGTVAGQRVLLAKPQTFMNVSGDSVNGLLVKNEIAPGNLILVYDELDLPWQSLRIRPNGSAGGHRGVDSVIRSVKTKEFPRVRLGIHGGRREKDGAHIVLAKLKRAQRQELDELLDYASQAVESIIAEGVEKSMAKFNRRAQGLKEEEVRIYEELFILRPDTPEEETDQLIEQLSTLITKHGGTVDKTDKWGIRKLAYRVQKRNEGFYVLLQFTAQPEAVKELERRMRVSDSVMKFITVRIDEKLKKIEKRKKHREKRAARRPAPQVAAPALSVENMMAGAAEPGPRPGAPMPGAPAPAAPAPAAAPPAAPVAPVEKE